MRHWNMYNNHQTLKFNSGFIFVFWKTLKGISQPTAPLLRKINKTAQSPIPRSIIHQADLEPFLPHSETTPQNAVERPAHPRFSLPVSRKGTLGRPREGVIPGTCPRLLRDSQRIQQLSALLSLLAHRDICGRASWKSWALFSLWWLFLQRTS